MLRLVVLVSGSGTNLADLIERTRGDLDAAVVAVGADRECAGLTLAEAAGIPVFVEPFAEPRAAWSDRLASRVLEFEPDLVVLSGFMRLLASNAVERLAPNLINTHPAYLPEFPGAHAVRDALRAGATETGASVIVVDAGVDTGPVIAQQRVAIARDDVESSLHDRIKLVERELLAAVIADYARTARTNKEERA